MLTVLLFSLFAYATAFRDSPKWVSNYVMFPTPKFEETSTAIQDYGGKVILVSIEKSDFNDDWYKSLYNSKRNQKLTRKAMYAHYAPDTKTDHSLIVLHGNAQDIHIMADLDKELSTKCNCHVFAIEYPGYSELQNRNGWGNPAASQGRLLAASRAALRDILQTFPANKAIIHGYSIGTGIAIDLAAGLEKAAVKNPSFKPLGLILVAPYTDIRSVGQRLILKWFRFLKYGIKNVLDNRMKIKSITVPTLYLHGEKDTLIRSHNSIELSKKQKKGVSKVILYPDSDHNDILSTSHEDAMKFILTLTTSKKDKVK